ncbi:MAG: dephospho-CoA kinase [Alphaproteobacteria bacterium]|nr:dephospho-CoA kinase [Alphaproteobacteria bacterium]
MIILGLTGSIGMGKSTAAAMLRSMRIPVYCADEAVHNLLGKNGKAVAAVAKLYPAAFEENKINRKILGAAVFHDAALMKQLEAILHPLVRDIERAFIRRNRAHQNSMGKKIVVLDIPLLFETHAEKRVDKIMVVSAPSFIQRARVLSRADMNAQKFEAILAKQMSDVHKRRQADYVIPTGLGRAVTFAALRRVMRQLP